VSELQPVDLEAQHNKPKALTDALVAEESSMDTKPDHDKDKDKDKKAANDGVAMEVRVESSSSSTSAAVAVSAVSDGNKTVNSEEADRLAKVWSEDAAISVSIQGQWGTKIDALLVDLLRLLNPRRDSGAATGGATYAGATGSNESAIAGDEKAIVFSQWKEVRTHRQQIFFWLCACSVCL
jgi:hypothetical protein